MERNNTTVNEDEIDLISLISALFTAIKKYIFIIIGIIAFSVFIGIVFYFRAVPYYKTRMIADSGTLPNTEVINIVDSWQSLIGKGDYISLANKLKLDIKTVQKLSNIEAEDTGTGKLQSAPGEKNENSFIINVVVTDVQILDSLENAIIYTIENNEYVKKRASIKKQNLEALKKKITAEIADLDSVKLSVRELLNSSRTTSGMYLTNPSEVNLQIVELYERILNLQTSLMLSDDIQVIENFTKTTQPDGPRMMPYITYGFVIGCVLAGLFIIIVLVSKKIKPYSNASVYSA